jgi:hypothetical protein
MATFLRQKPKSINSSLRNTLNIFFNIEEMLDAVWHVTLMYRTKAGVKGSLTVESQTTAL